MTGWGGMVGGGPTNYFVTLVGEGIVRLTDFAPSCHRLCFSRTLHVLLQPCRPVASLEAMYLLNPSKTFTLYPFSGTAVKLGGHQSKF